MQTYFIMLFVIIFSLPLECKGHRGQVAVRAGASGCLGVSERGTHVLKRDTITQAACGLSLAAKSSHSVCISDFSPRVI